jgi:hypothetical protein
LLTTIFANPPVAIKADGILAVSCDPVTRVEGRATSLRLTTEEETNPSPTDNDLDIWPACSDVRGIDGGNAGNGVDDTK